MAEHATCIRNDRWSGSNRVTQVKTKSHNDVFQPAKHINTSNAVRVLAPFVLCLFKRWWSIADFDTLSTSSAKPFTSPGNSVDVNHRGSLCVEFESVFC